MNRNIALALLAGVVAALAGASLRAHQEGAPAANPLFRGIFASHESVERYEMTIGVSRLGVPNRPTPIDDFREQLNYPDSLGSLISINDGPEGRTVLWFQDSQGLLRNVVVTGAAERLYRIEPRPARKFRTELPR